MKLVIIFRQAQYDKLINWIVTLSLSKCDNHIVTDIQALTFYRYLKFRLQYLEYHPPLWLLF